MMLKEFNLNSYQEKQFERYYEYLISENQKFNLTSITEKKEVYIKHFYDSLKVKDAIDLNQVNTLCDIGSGAGFPAIPIKIFYPHLNLTIIEPTQKRCKFLSEVVKLLELDNVTILNERSENLKNTYRDYFDVVVARAVASLPILLELTIPYVKLDGHFLAMKGLSYIEELAEAQNAIKLLDIQLNNTYFYELPDDLGKRVILDFLKMKKTNLKYPRAFAQIKKNHL